MHIHLYAHVIFWLIQNLEENIQTRAPRVALFRPACREGCGFGSSVSQGMGFRVFDSHADVLVLFRKLLLCVLGKVMTHCCHKLACTVLFRCSKGPRWCCGLFQQSFIDVAFLSAVGLLLFRPWVWVLLCHCFFAVALCLPWLRPHRWRMRLVSARTVSVHFFGCSGCGLGRLGLVRARSSLLSPLPLASHPASLFLLEPALDLLWKPWILVCTVLYGFPWVHVVCIFVLT